MNTRMLLAAFLIGGTMVVGCSPTADEVKKVVSKNPDIVYDVIRKDPLKFMEVLNEASNAAQIEMQKREMEAEAKKKEEEYKNPKKPVIAKERAVHGNVNAPITIVEYSDFQCPYCGRGYQTMNEVMKTYGDKVRIVYKHLPLEFHPYALVAAQYFEAIAKQSPEKAYKFHNTLFENQKDLASGGKEWMQKTAKGLGLNMKQLKKDLDSNEIMTTIAGDVLEANSFGFNGTPAFLVNGISVYGSQPFEVFKEIIDRHLKDAGK